MKNRGESLATDYDTYVFIDVSNIRLACKKTLGWELDFYRLMDYFRDKYTSLKEVRYYEGLATDDIEKKKELKNLGTIGYTICSLERKAYNEPAVYRKVRCRKCGHAWEAKVFGQTVKKKSNVDVYLAADMIVRASKVDKPTRIVVVSCDGDYAEAIKDAVGLNDKVSVVVLATPPVKDARKNTLSVRLKQLYRELPLHRYDLSSVDTIEKYVVQK